MAARKDTRHSDEVREKIQTSQLVNRLTDHVLNGAEMSKTQVSAAVALLKKTLPDLQAVEHSGDAQNPVRVVLDPIEANA